MPGAEQFSGQGSSTEGPGLALAWARLGLPPYERIFFFLATILSRVAPNPQQDIGTFKT